MPLLAVVFKFIALEVVEMARKKKSREIAFEVLVEQIWDAAKGEDFKTKKFPWRETSLSHKRELVPLLRKLVSNGYLVFRKNKELPYTWTERARAIKAAGEFFTAVQPQMLPGAEEGGSGRIHPSIADVPESPVPTDIHGSLAGEFRGPPALPPLDDGHNLGIGEMTSPQKQPVDEEHEESPLNLPLLFLTPEEAEVFKLMREAPLPIRLTWFYGLGLDEKGNGLLRFLEKLVLLGILAYGPDQGKEEKIFLMDTVKYPYYLENHRTLSFPSALGELNRERELLEADKAHLEGQINGQGTVIWQANDRVQLRIKELKEAQAKLEEAEMDLEIAQGELQQMEQEIQARDFPRAFESIESMYQTIEEIAIFYDSLEQHKLITLLLGGGGKEVK